MTILGGAKNKALLKELEKDQVPFKIQGADVKLKTNDLADHYGKQFKLNTLGSKGGYTFWSRMK